MARLARVVIPHVAHHITQRGNRRLPIFLSDEDRVEYLSLLARAWNSGISEAGAEVQTQGSR
jgi:putative transposase